MRDGTEELNCTIKQADERNSSTDYYAKQLKNIYSVQYIQNYTQLNYIWLITISVRSMARVYLATTELIKI